MRSSRAFWLVALCTASCAIKGFSIVDELPGSTSGANNAGGNAGLHTGGDANNGGKANGNGAMSGQTAQGGSSAQAGTQGQSGDSMADAGESAAGGAGGAANEPPAVAPCDKTPNGQDPLFCDDFESPSAIDPAKWLVGGANVALEMTAGPHGNTKAMRLELNQARPATPQFAIPAGAQLTVSFWFKVVTLQDTDAIISFSSQGGANARIQLLLDVKSLYWQGITMLKAPSAPIPNAPYPQDWTCLSIELSEGSTKLTYRSLAAGAPFSFVIDDTGTAGIDDAWQNQPTDDRHIAGDPVFGGSPQTMHGGILLDDIRMVSGTSNVCGF